VFDPRFIRGPSPPVAETEQLFDDNVLTETNISTSESVELGFKRRTLTVCWKKYSEKPIWTSQIKSRY
jgi:hypothetical protein